MRRPRARYGEAADRFVKAAHTHGWVLTGFDWEMWVETKEAERLRDRKAALARATPEQLMKLLTVWIRQERFVEGALLHAFEGGYILRIVRRAAEIVGAPPG